MKVLLAHPGTQHSRHLARELERHGLLHSFWTGMAFAEHSASGTLAGAARRLPGLRGLSSRIVPDVPAAKLHTLPLGELRALCRLRAGRESQAVLHERNAAFQRAIPDRALPPAGDAVIGFDTSSWLLAERCARRSLRFYLDRTIAHPAAFHRIMHEFRQRYPDWTGPAVARLPPLAAVEDVEHAQARKIVVGGVFARNTLLAEGIPADRIHVNPYGVDWAQFKGCRTDACTSNRPFRFLYVGSVIARKGVPVLLDAWRQLANRDAELWIAGTIGPRERSLLPDLPGLRFLGQVPHGDLPAVYASCDIFVFPSLFEGFGLVILEALAAGLPVISTPHTGAADAITNPALGQLVEAGSVEALSNAMRACLNSPPSRTEFEAAVAPLRKVFNWSAFGDRWAAMLQETA